MKKLLLALLLASTANSSNEEYVIEYGMTIWETELIKYIGVNETYAQVIPSMAPYFRGRADAYREILERINYLKPH